MSQYDYVGEFRCGFAEVKKQGKTIGYINGDGDLIYDDKTFDKALHFGSDTICVCINKKSKYDKGLWGILNSAGKYIIEPQFNYIEPIEFGPAIFSKDKKYGLINTAGEIVTLTQYDYLRKIEGANLILCKLNWKFGVLNYEGYKITPLKYDEILPYEEGLARIKSHNKYGFLDTTGNEVIPCIYDYAHNFSGELAKVCIMDRFAKKWGYINQKGEILIPCKYDNIANFGEDIESLARVECNNCYGYVNCNGKEVIPCKYHEARDFRNGLAKVELYGEKFQINRDGVKVKDGWD